MSIWYLVSLSFAIGCILAVDLPARQTRVADVPTSTPRKSPSTPATTAGTHSVR